MATNRFQIWQEEEDYHDWKRCLEKAIGRSDYVRVRELVEEGISFDYDFPLISDKEALEIIRKIRDKVSND